MEISCQHIGSGEKPVSRIRFQFVIPSDIIINIRLNIHCQAKNENPLDYVAARKRIYAPLYISLAKQEKLFEELKQMLKKGDNLLIIEVDGPHQKSLQYYKDTYKVKDDFIQYNTLLATKENLEIMLNDTKHSFGHGYCLAAALLDIDLQ